MKVEFQEKGNNYLKKGINSKQDLLDSILEHDSNLLRHQCCYLKQHPEIGQSNHGRNSDDKIVQTIIPGTLSPNIKEMLKTFLI